MIRRTPRSTRTDKLFPYTNALPIWQEDQLRRLTHSFSNRSRVSTFREFRTAEKAAELAPAFNHVAHAPVSLARLDRRGAITQYRLPRRLASDPPPPADRKSVVQGKSVSVRVALRGRRFTKYNNTTPHYKVILLAK